MAILDSDSPYKGSGQLTREQFLFYEMRTTARLLQEGLTDQKVVDQILLENLFQYPTEKTVKQTARACISRLHALADAGLIEAVATQDSYTAKQICLYAMMKQYRMIWDFMITVIGAKYQQQDYTFNRRDINAFCLRLQEQDDLVASWSGNTIQKIESVISRILIENEYINNGKSTQLNPVLICGTLEAALRVNGEDAALPAFNCFP